MKQLSFPLGKVKKEHGGSLAVGKRRSYRPLNIKQAHHITLKSNLATGGRCLRRHQTLIKHTLYKAAKRFNITIYRYAVAGNHLHVLVKAKSRLGMQNFFRVFAGHTAQMILKSCPLPKSNAPRKAGGAPTHFRITSSQQSSSGLNSITSKSRPPCKKNQRKFWGYLIYSRVLTWGREFRSVVLYVVRNQLEVLGVIAYQPRLKKTFSSA